MTRKQGLALMKRLARSMKEQCQARWRGKNKKINWCCQYPEGHEGSHITARGKRWLSSH